MFWQVISMLGFVVFGFGLGMGSAQYIISKGRQAELKQHFSFISPPTVYRIETELHKQDGLEYLSAKLYGEDRHSIIAQFIHYLRYPE